MKLNTSARRSVGPQAHVDPEHKAVDGHRVQGLDQFLAQADKELLVVEGPLGAHGLAAFGVGEDQVDVRRQVQFHRTQLAHAEDDHLLRLAAAPADGGAELRAVALVQPLVSLVDAGVGHVRQVAAGLYQVRLSGQVAPDDPHLLAGALATQHTPQLIFCFSLLHGCGNLPTQLIRRKAAVQLAPGHQLKQHQRVTNTLFNHKIAGGTHPGEVGPTLRRPRRQAMIGIQHGRRVTK